MPFTLYNSLKKGVSSDAGSADVAAIISDVYDASMRFPRTADRIDLEFHVPGKEYFAYIVNGKRSRAVNAGLFDDALDPRPVLSAIGGTGVYGKSSEQVNKAIYKIAMAFCCNCDIRQSGDQQRPGTFFQHLTAHLVARRLGVNPRKVLPVFGIDDPEGKATLPTDLVFDLGTNKAKFHVPVKTSTRERVIQVWAHQRVLDGVYGTGRFIGTLVCLAETKVDSKLLQVIEICIPDQWRIFQSFVAQMRRMYYLDVPAAYAEMDNTFPKIHVKAFGEFFFETERLIEAG